MRRLVGTAKEIYKMDKSYVTITAIMNPHNEIRGITTNVPIHIQAPRRSKDLLEIA